MVQTSAFLSAVDELSNSKLLVADNYIRKTLIALTNDKECLAVLSECSKGFQFENEYIRYFVKSKTLPEDKSTVVALVTSLLYVIDGGSLRLNEFITDFAKTDDSEDAYKVFLDKIIKPYREAVVELVRGEPIEDVKPTRPSYDKMNEDVAAVLDELIAQTEELKLEGAVYDDVIGAINGIRHAIVFSDALLTKTAFKGLFFALQSYRIRLSAMTDLMKILIIYGVL